MGRVEVVLSADCAKVLEEARILDWGALVSSNQGGVEVFVVGLAPEEAAALLREAADSLVSAAQSDRTDRA